MYKNVEELQARHREAEKLTNYYKAKHKEWAADKDREYQIDLDKWNSESHKISQENYRKIQSARAKFEVAKTTELERLAGLKIEIPNDLQDIVNEVLEKLEVK